MIKKTKQLILALIYLHLNSVIIHRGKFYMLQMNPKFYMSQMNPIEVVHNTAYSI